MLAVFSVDNLNDSGEHSLREAITIANENGEPDSITFSVAGVIDIDSQLPTITEALTIHGANQITINAGNGADDEFNTGDGFGIFHIEDAEPVIRIDVAIDGVTLIGGDAAGVGGAIVNHERLTLSGSRLTSNAASTGGALSTARRGETIVVDSTISHNAARNYGGAAASDGSSSIRGLTTFDRSAVYANVAGAFGGGVYNTGNLQIINSTLSENSAGSGGGGVYNGSSGQTTIHHSTLLGNLALRGSGIYDNFGSGEVTLTNSIIAKGASGADVGGERLQGAYNLIEDGTGGLGDTLVGDPLLGPLTDNGGPTLSHALLPGSLAINRGDPGFSIDGPDGLPGTEDDLAFDQRGEARLQHGRVDIGASESSLAATPLPSDLIVTTTEGRIDGDVSAQDLSLPEAIAIAHVTGAQDITFSPLFDNPQTIMLDDELGIIQPLAVIGPGKDLLTIDGGNGGDGVFNTGDGHRLFRIGDGYFLSEFVVEMSGMTLKGGDAIGVGGAIVSEESLQLADAVITGNAATLLGGGLVLYGGYAGQVSISNSTIQGNYAGDEGGGIFSSRIAVDLDRVELLDNVSATAGGGMFVNRGLVAITESTVAGNVAGENGGGIYNDGRLTISGSTLSGNSAQEDGGGIYAWVSSTLNIVRSTLVGNHAGDDGGGLFNGDEATLINSTLSGNVAGGRGGGAYNDNADRLRMTAVTLSGNAATQGGSIASRGTVFLNGSIVANSAAGGEFFRSGSNSNVIGAWNLVEDGSDSLPDTLTGDPLLGPLADHGGPTSTHDLLPGSFAVNRGDPDFDINGADGLPGTSDDVPEDQRGSARIQQGRIDLGAYESNFETPELPDALVVTTTESDRDGDFSANDLSLAEAIAIANFREGAEEISFSSLFDAPQTILVPEQLVISDDLTIAGPGADLLTLDAGHGEDGLVGTRDGSRIFEVHDFIPNEQSLVEIRHVRITGGDNAGDGGAIHNQEALSIVSSEIAGNAATNGGGIFNEFNGTLMLDDVLLSTSSSLEAGGGLYNRGAAFISESSLRENGAGTNGGAVHSSGDWTLLRSAVHNNIAVVAGGAISHAGGQATISSSTLAGNVAGESGGAIRNSRDMTIASSTISGNTASVGGGIHTDDALTIRHSTLTANSAETGGAIAMYARVNLSNTVVSDNLSGEQIYRPYDQSIVGSHNLVEDGSDNLVDTITGSAVLGPLADNGGSTRTHALLPGSLAINRGDPDFSIHGPDGQPGTEDDVPFDQRGGARIEHGRIDIGAYESTLNAPRVADRSGGDDCRGSDERRLFCGRSVTA